MPLFQHQRDALQWALTKRHPALFLEMRLGKTRVAIRFLQKRGCSRVLVVAPLSTLIPWQEELALLGVGGSVVRSAAFKHPDWAHGTPPRLGFSLTNYEALRANPSIASLPWDGVVLDESTRVKNPQAQITKVVTRGFRRTRHRLILSGLPDPEGPLDFCEQFRFLNGHFLGHRNYWQFRHREFVNVGYDWIPRPGVRGKIKRSVRRHAYVLSRKEAGLGNRRIFQKRYVEMNAEQRRVLKRIRSEWALDDDTFTRWRLVVQNWMQALAGGCVEGRWISNRKVQVLRELLTGELSQQQVVVCFRYNAELAAAWKALRAAGVSVTWVAGDVPLAERKARMGAFKRSSRRVMLLQPRAAQFGLDLSAASAMIFYSNYWDLEIRRQVMERIEHPEKNEPLLYIDLLTEGTLDEQVVEALRNKDVTARFFLQRLYEDWRCKR